MPEHIDGRTIQDDRTITYNLYGREGGDPVFLLHGSPGCRLGPVLRGIVLWRMGVLLVCPDRSGYGESDPNPGRTVADYAGDVASIADQLRLDRFAVLGRSGGGPHALGCAALLGDRVTRVMSLSSQAPFADSNAADHTSPTNEALFDDPIAKVEALVANMQADPEALIEHIYSDLTQVDLRFVDDVMIRRLLLRSYREAVRKHGAAGWLEDMAAIRGDWGFELEHIPTSTEVAICQPWDDTFTKRYNARVLNEAIPESRLVDIAGGHFASFEQTQRALAWCVSGREEALPR